MVRWYLMIAAVLVVVGSMLGRGHDSARPATGTTTVAADGLAGTAASDSRSATSVSSDPLDRSIELTRDQNGYFYADVQINGAPLHMLVDTGATVIALSRNDAQMARLPTAVSMTDVVGEGADGAVRGQEVMLDRVTLGDKTVEGLPAIVLNSGGQSLLGQSFLSKFSSVHIEGDKMILR